MVASIVAAGHESRSERWPQGERKPLERGGNREANEAGGIGGGKAAERRQHRGGLAAHTGGRVALEGSRPEGCIEWPRLGEQPHGPGADMLIGAGREVEERVLREAAAEMQREHCPHAESRWAQPRVVGELVGRGELILKLMDGR